MSERLLPPARHEAQDLGFRPMLIAAGLMLAALVLVGLGLWWLFPSAPGNHLTIGQVPDYPAPRLQASPRTDMARFYAKEMQRLHGTGWVDRAQGIVHIPIEDAMRHVAATGIPDWPTQPAKPTQPAGTAR